MKIKKIGLEYLYLVLVLAVLIWHPSVLWGHRISHDFPYAYLASDTFQHQTRVESIKIMGGYRNEAPYIVKGFQNVVGYYPPVSYHLGVILSYVSGLESYDSLYLLIFLFGCFSAITMYIIIRRFNKNIAILSIPLTALIFSAAPYVGFTWGHWPSLTGQFLLIAFVFSLFFLDSEKGYILSGLLLAGAALSHTSEAIFAVLFLVIYLLIYLILVLKKIDLKLIKRAVLAGILFFAASFYYLVIFKSTWAKEERFYFHVLTEWGGTPIFSLLDFKIVALILMLIGFFFLLSSFKKIPVLLAIFMLAVGYGNYIGLDFRAFQIRMFWPIYLSLFFGAGVYFILRKLKLKQIHYIAVAVLFVIIFAGIIKVPYLPHSEKLSTPGMMDSYHWALLSWFKDNSPKDSKIYFFYGDLYGQDAILRNTQRTHYLITPNSFVDALNNKTIKREYRTELPGDSGSGIPYRTSFFKFGSYLKEHLDEIRNQDRDICTFDYYVFDKVSGQQVLAQYNMLIANELLKKDWIKLVFENQISIILKNDKPGEDCIEPRNF